MVPAELPRAGGGGRYQKTKSGELDRVAKPVACALG